MAARGGFNPLKFGIDMVPYVITGVGVYETYLFASNTPPYFTPDPLYDFIKINIIPLLPKYTPPVQTGNCPAGQYRDSTGTCVPYPACPTGQVRDGAGVCVPINTTCTTPTTGAVGSPVTTVTIDAPVAESSIQSGTTLNAGGTIPAGVSLNKIGIRLLAGNDQSFVTQDWVEVVTWIDKLAPVVGPWNISLPIPSGLTPGRYLVAAHVIANDCTGAWPYKWINITAPVTGGGGDTVIPTVSITTPLAAASVPAGAVTVQGTAQDNVGVASVKVWIDTGAQVTAALTSQGGGLVAWTASVNVLTAGAHTIHVQATDNSGNLSVDTTRAITATGTSTGDTTAPVVNITSPTAGAVLTSSIVNVQGTASDIDSGVSNVFVRVSNFNTPWTQAVLSGGTWAITTDLFAASPTGPYTIEARAQDVAGNYNWANVTVTVNAVAPPTCPIGQKVGGTSGVCEAIVTTYDTNGTTIRDTFAPGGTVRVTGTGFNPTESVELRLRINQSTTQVVTMTANQSGLAQGIVTIPAGQAATTDAYVMCTGATSALVGRHTIAITATGLYGRRSYNLNSNRFLFRGGRFGHLISPYVYRTWS